MDARGNTLAQTVADGIALSDEYQARTDRLVRLKAIVNWKIIQDNSCVTDSWGLVHSRKRNAISAQADVIAALPVAMTYFFTYDGFDRITGSRVNNGHTMGCMEYDTWTTSPPRVSWAPTTMDWQAILIASPVTTAWRDARRATTALSTTMWGV